MATFNNGESLSSVRTKINEAIDKIDGNATISNDLTADGLNLAAISDTIEDTAVDIFVYDTRKDSDGGAWRKRTQHTSWYNETLNTATRGSRKEFPAVAVIVTVGNEITIYDGYDPSLPMWMYFKDTDTAAGIMAYLNVNGGASCVSISMLNGKLSAGFSTSVGGLYTIDFLADTIHVEYNTSFGYSVMNSAIDGRNTVYSRTLVDSGRGIVNRSINDVAMTVLPNAPIDAATGLLVPTIAVATDGGVSVIKDDGTVVDIVHSDSAFTPSIWLDGDTVAYDANNFLHARKIPSADVSAGLRYAAHSDDIWFAPRFYYPSVYSLGNFDLHPTGGQVYDLIQKDNDVSVANSDRLILAALSGNQERVANDASYAWITSSYNTGWMNGDIKLATLSDTDATNVTGSELVTNGTFDTDSDWTKGTGWTISGGQAVATTVGSGVGITQSITVPTTGVYTVTADITQTASNYRFSVGTIVGPSASTASGTISLTGTLAAGSHTVSLAGWSAGFSGTLDNVSVRLAEEDRSVNGNGLQVFGTVTKSAVASGADLVAYSGAEAANTNYLFQPYNSDLDFGIGDFSYTFWHSCASSSVDRIWLSHGKYTTAGSGLNILQLNSSGSGDEIYIYVGDSGAGNINVKGVEGLGFQQWVITRRNGIVYAYRNGKLEGSVANTNNINLSSATIKGLYVGKGNNTTTEGNAFAYGAHRLALFRISATAPSPEAIKRIYEDEKVLFQENAKAVLYGTSDAVTALAYDDSNGILSVGTSAGRSDFQGLRRVNNTTTAVTSAISASNGLIVEQ